MNKKLETNKEIPTLEKDEKDENNVAFGKPTRTNTATAEAYKVTDGKADSYWTGEFYPSYVDIDLMQNYNISEIILNFPVVDGRYYYYTVYASNDYSTFNRLYKKRNNTAATEDGDVVCVDGSSYRFVRVYIEYVSDSTKAYLSQVRVHGENTGENAKELRTGGPEEVLGIKAYSQTDYAKPITIDETIENVYGIIDRTVGAQYRSWFDFKLEDNAINDNDYYKLENGTEGKILITGNNGVSLASGLNHYYKYFCNVMISEQANQIKMPENVVKLENAIRKESPYKIRYAFNYCTINYTFPFFGVDDYQKENDWLALNGVNVVLDLAGQEAVWIKFLTNFGYSIDEAKDWLTGPGYVAWQLMDNMETFGGPVPDGWIVDRLEMARSNQRWKNSLGMQTVLQGYAGMVPTNFNKYQDVALLEQGMWNDLNRPSMIRTDGALYDEYAQLFYQSQEWALGATTNYYAVDPFHEGGIRPSDLSDNVIANEVLESLLSYNKNAVWMVQSWLDNPTDDLLRGMGDRRQEHVVILDLLSLHQGGRWGSLSYNNTTLQSVEFNKTDWVWCIFKNMGGVPSMDGPMRKMIDEITRANKTAQYMKGIGTISEATYDNPVVRDLLFEMAWEKDTIDLDKWLDNYVLRRYGKKSEKAREAWSILEATVYSHIWPTHSMFYDIPDSASKQTLPYSQAELQKALKLLLADYDHLSSSEAYAYDLTELMRQILSNNSLLVFDEISEACQNKDLDNFKKAKDKFMNLFDVCNLVLGTQQDLLVGEWIGKAEDWAKKYDDFAYDSFVINAKALITTWVGPDNSGLNRYAIRQYEGSLIDIYKTRWEVYLNKLEANLTDDAEINKLSAVDYSYLDWEWVMNQKKYTRESDNSKEHVRYVASKVINECLVE